jgi:hypothetical protein
VIGLPNRHHNHYSRNLKPAIPSDLDPNTHFVGVRLISTGGKPLCQTRFSLSCAISMHGLFLLCFLLHQLRCPDFSHIFHINTQSLGGAAGSRFYQSLVAGFIARTFPHRSIAGLVYILASGGYILEYLLCCTEGLPTRLCNELSASLAQR